MSPPVPPPPLTRPSMKYFQPYRQTVIGFLVVTLCVVLLILAVRRDPPLRKLNAWCWMMLVNLVFGLKLRDIDCAFKIYPRRLFEEIEMRSKGALIDAEILARAKYRGYRIGQVGVHHYERIAGTQTGANPKVIARTFYELFKLYGHIRLGVGGRGR